MSIVLPQKRAVLLIHGLASGPGNLPLLNLCCSTRDLRSRCLSCLVMAENILTLPVSHGMIGTVSLNKPTEHYEQSMSRSQSQDTRLVGS